MERVIERLDADVWVFQEVLDASVLLALLGRVGERLGRSYRLRDSSQKWLTSAGNAAILKVAVAYDERRLTLRARHKLPSPASRSVAVELQVAGAGDGAALTLIGVHLKSSPADVEPTEADTATAKRAREAHAIAAWVEGFDADGQPFGLATPEAVLIGDLNERAGRATLQPLREGAMTSWTWHELASPVAGAVPWTCYLDHVAIDHVLTSSALSRSVVREPWIDAFELDPSIADPAWMNAEGPIIVPGIGLAPCRVPNFYRVSDHRPIVLDLDLG